MDLSRSRYIKQIDGLRGISVLSVVLYHFFPDIFKGGFIGVDIFFVISGFVISKVLIEEFEINKKISLKNFYIKRIKRLFPAFFLIIFVSSIFSYFILLPDYLLDFSKSSLHQYFFHLIFISFFKMQIMQVLLLILNHYYICGRYQLKNSFIFFFQFF